MTSHDLDAELHAVLGAPMTEGQLAALDDRLRTPGIGADDGRSRPQRGPIRRRQGIILVAAAAVLLAAASLAVANQPPPDPAVVARNAADEERVLEDLGSRTESACLSREQATTMGRERLDALGLSNWTIRVDDRIKEARCVTFGVSGDIQEVLLVSSMGGDVAKALDRLAADLMARCVARDDAVSLVSSTLTNLGVNDPKIAVTGIRQIPIENGDAYVAHVKGGCYVYGGAQFDDVGRYTWFVSGP